MAPTLTVWKYPLTLADVCTIEMPHGAQILTVQVQPAAQGLMLWALVNPEAGLEPRTFRLAGTGHPVRGRPEDLAYVGSVQLDRGALVFHLFELLDPRRVQDR